MSCENIWPDLEAYVEGELAAPERAVVTAHLASCPACLRRVEALEQITGLLYQMPREPAPEGLAERILAGVDARREVVRTWTARTVLAAVGALIAGLMAGWLALQTAVAVQAGGALDFVSLFLSQPGVLQAYPQYALSALVESLPATELVVTLGMLLVALLLLNQLLTGLDRQRMAPWAGGS